MSKVVQPQLGLESFSCPHSHCGALAHQTWYQLFGVRYEKDAKPWTPLPGMVDDLRRELKTEAAKVIEFYEKMLAKEVFFEDRSENFYSRSELINVYVSKCYSCGDLAIWRSDSLIQGV